MSIGAREIYLCLPLDKQFEKASASSIQVERDRKERRVQGSGVTSRFSLETGGRIEACFLLALFLYITLHKLLYSAFGEATRGQRPLTASRKFAFDSCLSIIGPYYYRIRSGKARQYSK
jgi:hypothetical protein